MKLSPTFKHAIESFEHGLEHYLDGTERSRKFSLLHIDQAVELLLKEKIIRLGKSVYKADGTTLGFHEAFNSLRDLKIPERPRLEELHDLRNTVQHKGLSPDADSTDFYVENAYEFVKRFLRDELATPIEQVLGKQYRTLIEGRSLPEATEILRLFGEMQSMSSPSEKIIAGYTTLIRLVGFFSDPSKERSSIKYTLKQVITKRGGDPKELSMYLHTIVGFRHQVVHGDYLATEGDAEAVRYAIEEILKLVGLVKS